MPKDRGSTSEERTLIRGPHPDAVLRALAARQHGVVARRQLMDAGFVPSVIKRRTASGHLVPLHRGVYAVGHRHLRPEGHWIAAVLAAGPGAVLSHRSAAALHGLRSSPTRPEVSTPGQRQVAGIRIHGRRRLDAADITTLDAIPVTTVVRTLVDLAEMLPHRQLVKALGEAERQYKLDTRSIEEALRRTRGRRGSGHAKVRAAMEELATHGPTLTRSSLEDAFLQLVEDHDLPRPAMNASIGPLEVDAVWHRHRLAVELDGYAHHADRAAFQQDRSKGNRLTAAGWRLLRFTWDDVVRHPARTAAQMRAFL